MSFFDPPDRRTAPRARVSRARETNQRLTTESHVQQTVVQFLELDGWRAIRTDPVSDRSRGKGFGEIGMPDYLFIRYHWGDRDGAANGWTASDAEVLWIEFKRKGATRKPHQTIWAIGETKRGALVLVVDDIDEFARWYLASGLNRKVVK